MEQQESYVSEYIERLGKEQLKTKLLEKELAELQEMAKGINQDRNLLIAERGKKGLSYDLVETILAIPNTDLQVKMLHEIKQQFLA